MCLRFVKGILLVAAVLTCLGSQGYADEFHYNNFLIGDRASGMGGAYTAVSDDPSGLYYNPAGIVYSTGRNLSASVNAFYNLTKKYENVIGGNGWERKATALLPNFFGIVQPLGRYKFGFSYAVPDSIEEDQDQFFTNVPTNLGAPADLYVINFNNEDDTYLFGPSLAAELTKNLSVGLTLYLHHRSRQTTMNQFISLQGGGFQWENLYIEQVERGYKPILGVMWSPMDKFSFGLSVAKTLLYGGSTTVQATKKEAAATDVDPTIESRGETRKYPTEVRAGAAYFPSASLLLTMDAAYYTKVTDPVYGDRVNVLNAAVGAEYYLDRNWALRGGLFSNMASTPELQTGRFDQDEKIDLYGLSLSISNFTRNTSVTFGGNIMTGSGKAQIISGASSIQDAEEFGWSVFLSSSYSY